MECLWQCLDVARAMPLTTTWAWKHGVLAGTVVTFLVAGLGAVLDADRDGDAAWQELRAGTRMWHGDSDGDGLEDGWERRAGFDARSPDMDGDGLADGAELALGGDPRNTDSDGDGLPDGEEARQPDCNGDGIPAIAQGDGDGDGRIDGLEAAVNRCTRDADGDGVPDGSEGNDLCVRRVDCDGDGLPDGQDQGAFDALDPDSFDSGVPDSVSFAFQQAGQPPGADGDGDGIPDPWEDDDGLIVWGDLRPQAGQRDLLVEFVRVQGPQSGRAEFAQQSFVPAYRAVAEMLAQERGVQLRWVETLVVLQQEAQPDLVPQLEDPYYADVLARARHSANPYVTTIVLNPQHDQSQLVHSGVAPIRGMLAAVDYGAHMQVTFAGNGTRVGPFPPIVESLIRGGQTELLLEAGFESGYTQAGDMGLRFDGNTLLWTPDWFRANIRLVADGKTTPLSISQVQVNTGPLASTILHELGHTLGLCHAHDPDCNAAFSATDRARQATSTMSYDAPANLLHFLDSEWKTVLQYIACPPDGPVTAVASGAPSQDILDAKYAYSNKDLLDVGSRACSDFTPLPRQFAPNDPPPQTFVKPTAWDDPADDPQGPTLWLVALAAGLAAIAAATWIGGRWSPSRP